jgi:hypothetical protein
MIPFTNDQDIHASSENYEEIGYCLDLNLYQSCVPVPYLRRSGLVGKSNHLMLMYLIHSPHLLVRATSERFLSAGGTFRTI